MAVAKFNWHGTNPNKAFQSESPPKAAWPQMVKFGATKEETESAYQALLHNGRVSDFKTKVWNDICAKVYDLCDDWNINQNFRTDSTLSPFIHDPDKSAWREIAKKQWLNWDDEKIDNWISNMWKDWKPGTFTAWNYNVVYSQWLAPLGLSGFTVKSGQRLKGEYILRLVEYINHWTELLPLDVALVLSLQWNGRNKMAVLPVLPVHPADMNLYFQLNDHVVLCKNVAFQIQNAMEFETTIREIALLNALCFSSLMNFMTLNVQCHVWDKEIIYVAFEVLVGVYQGIVKVEKVGVSPLNFSDTFLYGSKTRLRISNNLQEIYPLLFFESESKVSLKFGNSYSICFSDFFSYSGRAKLRRTARPLPFAVQTEFASTMKARVDFEGIHMLDMTPGRVEIHEQINPDVRAAKILEQEQQIYFSNYKNGMTVVQAATLEVETEKIAIHGVPEELLGAVITSNSHRGKATIHQEIQLLDHPPEVLTHSGRLENIAGGAELTFANEESLDVRAGSFRVSDGNIDLAFQDTQAMAHNGLVDTKEQISISQDPPLSIEGSANIDSSAYGILDRNRVLEQAAETAIETASYAEIMAGLNKILETEITAAKTSSMAELYVRRYFHLSAEEELTSREYGVLDKRIRRLMESSNTTATRETGAMLLRLIRFATGDGVAEVYSEAQAVRAKPKHTMAKENTILTGLSAFLDASYVRGDSLISAQNVSVLAQAEVNTSVAGSYLAAQETAGTIYETELQRMPSKTLFGGEIARTGAEAKLMMARTEKILALEYEDTLVTELDEINAADVERHLIFS